MVAPWRRCTAALPRHAAFTFPTPSCLSSDAFDFAAFIHQCTRAMLTPHLSLPTLATEALLCIVRTPAASLLASSPPLFCVTLCPSLKRERWIRSGSRVWKGRESEIASDRGERRGRGHLEGGTRREKRRFSLIYAIAVPHLFIVAPCQLKKKRHAHSFLVDICFQPHFLLWQPYATTFTFNWLHTCTRYLK